MQNAHLPQSALTARLQYHRPIPTVMAALRSMHLPSRLVPAFFFLLLRFTMSHLQLPSAPSRSTNEHPNIHDRTDHSLVFAEVVWSIQDVCSCRTIDYIDKAIRAVLRGYAILLWVNFELGRLRKTSVLFRCYLNLVSRRKAERQTPGCLQTQAWAIEHYAPSS